MTHLRKRLKNDSGPLFYSEIFNHNAKKIFRFVSILLGFPCSIRIRVIDEMFAFLSSSVLLIMKDSLILSIYLQRTVIQL
jgi:hypothetical protein